MDTKYCKKCNTEKNVTEFYINNRNKDGLSHICKECARDYSKRYYQDNIEKCKRNKSNYRSANRSKYLTKQAEWRKNNRDKVNEWKLNWRLKNKEQINEYQRQYRKKNIEKFRARKWDRTPEQKKMYKLARKARKNKASGYCTQEQFNARWEYYGGLCYLCGSEATTVDHIKPLSKGGSNWPCNLRPACRSCNSSKNNKWPYLSHVE